MLGEELEHGSADVRGGLDHLQAAFGEVSGFVDGSAVTTTDDGAGVAHAAAGRSRLAGDEADDGLLVVGLEPVSCGFFSVAADFADEDETFGLGVGSEELDDIEELRTVDRVATDADAGRLAEAGFGELVDGFVGEGAGARHDADFAGLVDEAGHDADLADAGGDDAGAVGADDGDIFALDGGFDFHHVEDGDAFGDDDDQLDAGVDRFDDRVSGEGRGDEDARSVALGLFDRFGDGVEDRQAFDAFAAFTGGDTADEEAGVFHFDSVFFHQLGV